MTNIFSVSYIFLLFYLYYLLFFYTFFLIIQKSLGERNDSKI